MKFLKQPEKKCTMCFQEFSKDNPCRQHLRGAFYW